MMTKSEDEISYNNPRLVITIVTFYDYDLVNRRYSKTPKISKGLIAIFVDTGSMNINVRVFTFWIKKCVLFSFFVIFFVDVVPFICSKSENSYINIHASCINENGYKPFAYLRGFTISSVNQTIVIKSNPIIILICRKILNISPGVIDIL